MGLLENNGAVVTSDPGRPDLGFFLVASRTLPRGALVLREEPLLRVPGGAGRRRLPDAVRESASALRLANLFVPSPGSSEVVRRLRQQAPSGEPEDSILVRDVLHFNSFAAGLSGADEVVFATLSRANHDCAPNCMVDGDEGTLRTIRDVANGDQLTISYLDEASLLLARDARRALFQERWDFLCGCGRCTATADDTRRFSGCNTAGCTGDLLAEETGPSSPPHLRCSSCGSLASAQDCQRLLDAEAAAAAQLSKAQDGDQEEEDQGQQLMRCYMFASKHPRHAVALELANIFAFPDALPAKRTLLAGLEAILGDMPCQLAIDERRELAEILAGRGEKEEARSILEAAAAMASVLDGRADASQVLDDWEANRSSSSPHPVLPATVADIAAAKPDYDLGLGAARPTGAAAVAAAVNGSAASSAGAAADAATTALVSASVPTRPPPADGSEDRPPTVACLTLPYALAAVAAAMAAAFLVRAVSARRSL
mmetsp:Transcript_104793/g.295064  ORF Transcript_104793/g.295064 Transcript_104793/m.295064 type:complete len:486 (-) Transcript_104793:68-1525(-)